MAYSETSKVWSVLSKHSLLPVLLQNILLTVSLFELHSIVLCMKQTVKSKIPNSTTVSLISLLVNSFSSQQ